MIGVGALAFAYLCGVDRWRLGLLGVVLYVPILAVPLVVYAALKGRSGVDDRAAIFCENVSSELRSGLSLRDAVVSAAGAVGVFAVSSGRPGTGSLHSIVEGLEKEFEGIGRELRATIDVSNRSGGAAAAVFDEIGSIALAQAEIAREVRNASAAARATAGFFLLAPAAYFTYQMHSGGLSGSLFLPQQRVAAVIGFVLFLAGLGCVVFLIWRAR